jgi:succinate-acetate transporter protein
MIKDKKQMKKVNKKLAPYLIVFGLFMLFLQVFFDNAIIDLIKLILWVIFFVFMINISKKYYQK